MSDERPWYLLTDRDRDRIFDDLITKRLLADVRKPPTPVLVTVHGPAGSGKTTAQRHALQRLGDAGAVIADVDALLDFHPHYAELQAQNDRTASALLGPDTVAWLNRSVELARDRRLNLIREGGPAPGRLAAELSELGYHTELDVMAVQPAVSRLAVLSRYQDLVDRIGVGRTVDVRTHDRTREMLPKLLTANEHRGLFDETRLWRRDDAGDPLYHDRRDGPGAAAAYRDAEMLPLTPAESEWFVRRFTELEERLPPDLGEQLDEIAELARPLGVDVRAVQQERRLIGKFTQVTTAEPTRSTSTAGQPLEGSPQRLHRSAPGAARAKPDRSGRAPG